jgi:hypothetical protein
MPLKKDAFCESANENMQYVSFVIITFWSIF